MQPGWAPVTTGHVRCRCAQRHPPCVEVRFKNRQACAQDPYEPDNVWGTATLAGRLMPAPQKHTVEPPTDLDWVKFAGTGRRHLHPADG